MNLTKNLIKEKFKEYNKAYFENKLKICHFSIYSSNIEKGRYTTNRIWVNKKINWTEETLKGVIIHEMVHYYLDSIVGEKTFFSPHGIKFRKICSKIKEKYNYIVPMSNPIFKYEILKQKKSLTFIEKLEILYLKPLNYLLSWLF